MIRLRQLLFVKSVPFISILILRCGLVRVKESGIIDKTKEVKNDIKWIFSLITKKSWKLLIKKFRNSLPNYHHKYIRMNSPVLSIFNLPNHLLQFPHHSIIITIDTCPSHQLLAATPIVSDICNAPKIVSHCLYYSYICL